MKDKILKHLQKAFEDINTIIVNASTNKLLIVNIDLEYMGQQIDDLICELELIDEIEMEDDGDITLFDEYDDDEGDPLAKDF